MIIFPEHLYGNHLFITLLLELPIKNLNRNFLIREVILHTKTLNRKNRLKVTDALLKHGNMENRMNGRLITRKFQLIYELPFL